VPSLCRPASFKTVARDQKTYEVDGRLQGVQVVRWGQSSTESAGVYTIFCENGNENHNLEREFFVQKEVISAYRRVESVSGR
jgi:hypothetical protein